ncbi:MAG: hypothetical protein GYB42_07510 [Alphaproteobacteria bacterium]|nr:hypothetical protein [Alphaproteobacteria bacterium]
MSTGTLTRVRQSILPKTGDSWASIAKRELANQPEDEAISSLQSWNLHIFMRAPAPEGSPRAGNPILPSDVIFIEPPLAGV